MSLLGNKDGDFERERDEKRGRRKEKRRPLLESVQIEPQGSAVTICTA